MTLHHHRAGSGEPLVLVHGLASRWQAWERVLPALEARFDVIALDLPGFGASAADGTGPSIPAQAQRVERFFEEAGVERPHVAGFSMGGAIALELARRGAVASATAISPAGFWTDRERVWCQRSIANTKTLSRLLAPALPALLRNPVGRTVLLAQYLARPWRASGEEAIGGVAAIVQASGTEACSAAFDEYRFHDADELRGVPVTVAWGDRDWLLLPRQAGRARRMLPWARHVTLHGCGHSPFADDTEQVAQVLLAGAGAGEPARAATAV